MQNIIDEWEYTGMDGWMDAWIERWMDELIDGWMEEGNDCEVTETVKWSRMNNLWA